MSSQPPYVQVCSVIVPEAASKSAIAARGSMAFATSRLLISRSLVTWAALATAASTAAGSPNSQSKLRLFGTSGWPGAHALAVSATTSRARS